MRAVSIYSGSGGIDIGLRDAGIKTTLAIDHEHDCVMSIRLNFGCEVICDEMQNVKGSIGRADIIVGGPPCPDFSRANVKRNYDAVDVNLFWEIVDEVKPKYFLMENVPDVIKVCKRKNFQINCANYGTPQTRIRRFYTNLPEPKRSHSKNPTTTLFEEPLKKWVSVREALGLKGVIEDRKNTRTNSGEERKDRIYDTDKPSHSIVTDPREWFISKSGHITQNREKITRSIDEPSDTIVNAGQMKLTNYEINSIKKIRNRKVLTLDELRGKNPIMYEKHPPQTFDLPSSTINTKDRALANDFITDGKKARKLTNAELAILQGFPKNYKFWGTKTSIRKQIGNAVPPQPVEALFKQISMSV